MCDHQGQAAFNNQLFKLLRRWIGLVSAQVWGQPFNTAALTWGLNFQHSGKQGFRAFWGTAAQMALAALCTHNFSCSGNPETLRSSFIRL